MNDMLNVTDNPLAGFRQAFGRDPNDVNKPLAQPAAPAPVQPQPQAPTTPGAPATAAQLTGLDKRAHDAAQAQSRMARERNSLEAILAAAREMQDSLRSSLAATAGIKSNLGTVKSVTFTPSGDFDPTVREDHPWLYESLTSINTALSSLTTSFNALLAALGGYADSVGAEHEAFEERTSSSLFAQLDRVYPKWRSAIDANTPDGKQFYAWLSAQPGPAYVKFQSTIQDCKTFADGAEMFDAYEAAFPGALQNEAILHAGAPGGAEASAAPTGAAAAVVIGGSEIQPLSREEAANFQVLYARAKTPEERQLLEQRHLAFTRAALRGM